APAPAGWGVEPRELQLALPWFRPSELVVFANLFGQRREVAQDVAVDFAAEVGRRLSPGHAKAAAVPGGALSPKDVAAVAYGLSKLSVQLPETSTPSTGPWPLGRGGG
ncbi:unnamed protein product, partial [Prorocentrum cordatum]